MNIKLIAIGKTDNKNLQTLIADYSKRLGFYIKFEFEVIPDLKKVKNLSEAQQKEKEGELILKRLSKSDTLVLLDENGKQFTSVDFSGYLQKHMNSGIKNLILVIGGPYGFSEAIYKRAQGKISLSKMSNSLSLNGLRVLFGLIGTGSIGLIFSFVISLFIESLHFVKDFISRNKIPKTKISKQKGYLMVREYKDFPLANLPHALSDNLRYLIVAFIIIDLFSENMFGSFDHSFRMLRIPIMIIGASMSQVFFNRISEYKKQAIQIYPLFKKLLISLILLSIAPFSIIYFFGGEIFSFVFGDEWYLSGKLSEIMAPWLMLNFILSPLSTIPLVFNKQKQFFILGLIASILQLGGFFILPMLFKTHADKIFYVFSIVSWLQVILSILIIYYLFTIVKQHDSSIEEK